MASREPLHIIGAGSIGLLWAASIRSKFPTYPLTVLLRDSHRVRVSKWRPVQPLGTVGRVLDGPQDGPEMGVMLIKGQQHQKDLSTTPPSMGTATSNNTRVSIPVAFINEDNEAKDDAVALPIQNLIVTTKSYQVVDAVQSVLPRLLMPRPIDGGGDDDGHHRHTDTAAGDSSPSRVIVLCNGALSVRDELQTLLNASRLSHHHQQQQQQQQQQRPTCSLVLATTTHGAYREDVVDSIQPPPPIDRLEISYGQDIPPPTHPLQRLIHAGYGTTFIEDNGGDGGYGRRMASLWSEAGLNCTTLPSHEMEQLLWKKLAANCVINPLTALFHCTNGELLLEPSFPPLQQALLEEVAAVMTGTMVQKNDPESHKGGGAQSLSTIISAPPPGEAVTVLRDFVAQVIRDTRDNKSSMYQDIIRGQKTEIEHLNGYVVRKGRELGLECPANEDLHQRIRELEGVCSLSSSSSSAGQQ
jgi:ketopantoate reductase